jgi:hypothetical protein
MAAAVSIQDVNTLGVTGSVAPQPDIIMVARTPSNDGIVTIPHGGTGVFVVALTNVGATFGSVAAGRSVSEWVQAGTPLNPAPTSMCETNPVTSECIPPSSASDRRIAAGETATFAVFVSSDHAIQFDPAKNRTRVEAFEQFVVGVFEGQTWRRGLTSVAVRTQP